MKEYIVMESFYKALEKDRIQPFYQPQFKSNGFDIVSAEALCRWVRSDGSLILPVDFPPLTEESGEICMLDWFIIDRVCSFLAEMLFMNERPVPVSVNLSRRHVEEMNAAEHLCTIVDAYRLNHDLIEVEITETCDAD
ncbi:MAG: EAL domain-containing protein, partial [Lachnospiraceae bacterium]|nr:EAL domain-containing protein [Lachnospiraceae bacterium]